MKRILAFFLLAVLMLAGCGKQPETVKPVVEPEFPGVYWRTWREDIGGSMIDLNAYIVLNADHTGYWIAQDVGTLTWGDGQIMQSVGAACDIALTQEDGTVKLLVSEFQADMPRVYEQIEKLPAEIESMLH